MHVTIPVASRLKVELASTPRKSPIMCVNSFGRPWREITFSQEFHKAAVKAGIVGRTYHDLRGSAVTRLAEAGCTTAEIASVTGHSLGDAGRILDRYLKRTAALAKSAISKLETRTVLETKLETGDKS
jgi:integrase